jgi:hypothetical protein
VRHAALLLALLLLCACRRDAVGRAAVDWPVPGERARQPGRAQAGGVNCFRKISALKWTKNREIAAIALAEGDTHAQAAEKADVTDRTIRNWLQEPEFSEEVDRLTFLTGIAHKAERLRMAKRVIARLGIWTEKDLLDWLKYAQSETDGIKLDLSELLTAIATDGDKVAGS